MAKMTVQFRAHGTTRAVVKDEDGEVVHTIEHGEYVEYEPLFLSTSGYAPFAEGDCISAKGNNLDRYVLTVSGTSGKMVKRGEFVGVVPKFEKTEAPKPLGAPAPVAGSKSGNDKEE